MMCVLTIIVRILLAIAILATVSALLRLFPNDSVRITDLILPIILVQPAMVITACAVSARHAILVRHDAPPYITSFRGTVLAIGMNIILPGRISEVLKITYLREFANIPASTTVGALVAERLMDIIVVSAVGFIGLSVFYGQGSWIAIAIFTVATSGLAFLPKLARYFGVLIDRRPGRLFGFAKRTFSALTNLDPQSVRMKAVPLTLVAWGGNYLSIYLFFSLCPQVDISWALAAVIFVGIVAAGAIPGLPAGLGAFEAAVVLVLQQTGTSFTTSLALALALHIGQLFLFAIASLYLLATSGTGVSSLYRDIMGKAKTKNKPKVSN